MGGDLPRAVVWQGTLQQSLALVSRIQSRAWMDRMFPPPRMLLILDNLAGHYSYDLVHWCHERGIGLFYTPCAGSWLNMAEIEFSVMVGQCLKRRIPDQATLTRELATYTGRRNHEKASVRWQFDVQQARTKLGRLYPQLS